MQEIFFIYTFQLFFDKGYIARGTRRFEDFLDEIIEKKIFHDPVAG